MQVPPHAPPCSHESPGIVLATLNARYIHASLGLRYLLANMARHGGQDLRNATVLREYTVARPVQEVVDDLLQLLAPQTLVLPNATSPSPPIVGFGVYIWNVAQTTEVVRQLKTARPDVRVVLGGPEVSHELDTQPIVALADHVITGWGDVSFPKLCHALVHGPRPLMKVIAGEQPALDQIALPYAEFSDADLAHRLLYVEASRGCPFKCEFCLSALDKTAWAFDEDRFLAEIATLYQRGARNYKFVDRTFNLKIDASVRILQFFLDRLAETPGTPLFLHFEVVPDHLPDRLKASITQFPPGVLQFEVGIQSFNVVVQQRIARRQDNAKTEANLRWLLDHSHAHLHTDLIFGLPGETWESFAQGFDALYAIGPHEIQLGVLKRLRGTPLAQRSRPGTVAEYGMVYDAAPPYTVQCNDAVSAEQVQVFVRLARYWDLVANSGRFARTLALVMVGDTPFGAFAAMADWLWARNAQTQGLTPEQLVDALFDYLSEARGLPLDAARAALLADYVASGARSSPRCLQGHLPPRNQPNAAGALGLNQRQQRHGVLAADASAEG
jgi:radical SAM superfamily enzyme YgiQ (UPF0313 family)